MLHQFAVEIPHVTSRPVFSHLIVIPEKMLRHSFVSPRRKERPAKHLGHMVYVETFFRRSTCIFISSLSSRIESMGTTIEEPLHVSTTFACLKIRFKTEVCSCSQFPTEAVLWIKEVELVDSVDELRSSPSISTRCEDCFSAEQNHP